MVEPPHKPLTAWAMVAEPKISGLDMFFFIMEMEWYLEHDKTRGYTCRIPSGKDNLDRLTCGK